SLRYKLLLLVLFPILIVLPTVVGLTIYWSLNYTYNQLYAKVRTDLLVAGDVFERLQQDYLSQLEGLAKSYSFRTALELGDRKGMAEQIEVILSTTHFDYLRVLGLDQDLTQTRPSDPFQTRTPSPLLEDAYRFAKPGVGVQLFHNEDIEQLDPVIAKRIVLPLIETPRAEPTSRVRENRGLVVRAVYPVRDATGQLAAILDGGVLLNNNFNLVDDIRDLVYGPGSVPEEGWGTVTVFLDDVRISTNVPLRRGQRALGTRVSKEVRDHVLGEGRVWVDRAFVVNDWYISAYKPIEDVYGDRVGMLYAGILESPYTNAYLLAVSVLLTVILLTALIAGWLAIRGAKSVFNPIEAMARG
ncbi:MAG: cache domain-containing protein, partial [Saprospiraceae bacterium]|nr:cache domain-containing protein [Saprospiraceae bacterium]